MRPAEAGYGGFEVDVMTVKNPNTRRLVQCKDWCSDEITPTTMWRLIALSNTVRARPALVTTTDLTRRAKQISRRWDVPVMSPADFESARNFPVPNPAQIDRRWESRLNDDGKMRELLLRGVSDLYERQPMY